MRILKASKFRFNFLAVTLSFCVYQAAINDTAMAQNRRVGQPKRNGIGNYLEMPEEKQKQFIAEKAELVSSSFGNVKMLSIAEKITPEAVIAIKPFVDAYAKRRDALKSTGDCKFEQERLSSVLSRWWQNYEPITLAFQAERDLEKAPSDREWEWIAPSIGVFLAMVESEFCPCYQGTTGSLGAFQLTQENAVKYGLKIRTNNSSSSVDERCDLKKSATAAAKLFKSLAEKEEHPLRTLTALARYHRGADVSLPKNDQFWEFVARKEFRAAIPAETNSNNPTAATAPVETQAFEYVRKMIAAAVILEYPEFFDPSLPPQASSEARLEKMWNEFERDMSRDMTAMYIYTFIMNPRAKPDDFTNTPFMKEAAEDLNKLILASSSVEARRKRESDPKLKDAPPWLKNLVNNLSLVRGLSARISSVPHNSQTVYYLSSNFHNALFNEVGAILCVRSFDEKGGAFEKCPDFDIKRSDEKLIWQSVQRTKKIK